MNEFNDPETARKILSDYKRFAIVGCSSDSRRPSFRVSRYLKLQGYEVTPINPNESEVHGLTAYPDLRSAPGPLEVVDIFRRSEEAGAHVDEAIEVGAKAIWMQLDVIDEAAGQRARDAGLLVVMDRCPAIDHPAFFGTKA